MKLVFASKAVRVLADSKFIINTDSGCATSQEVIILRHYVACDLRVMYLSSETEGKQPGGLTKNC